MIKLEIRTLNAAFENDRNGELARIFREIAYKLEYGRLDLSESSVKLFDINGNVVGRIEET